MQTIPWRVLLDNVCRPRECWEWQGYLNRWGYGQIKQGPSGTRIAHRYFYEALNGPVPDGLVVDHICFNRKCVNPRHLQAIPQRENVMRSNGPTALNARKQSCKRGHTFDTANTITDKNGYGRRCRICLAERSARWAAANPDKIRETSRRQYAKKKAAMSL